MSDFNKTMSMSMSMSVLIQSSIYISLHDIVLVCEIVTSNEIHNFVTVTLQK